MPEMGGRLVAESVATIKPGIKILFFSGYTDDAVVRYGVSNSEVAFLQKPFRLEGLAKKVREVLDQ
jgi:two-component SAPR family response regulator